MKALIKISAYPLCIVPEQRLPIFLSGVICVSKHIYMGIEIGVMLSSKSEGSWRHLSVLFNLFVNVGSFSLEPFQR